MPVSRRVTVPHPSLLLEEKVPSAARRMRWKCHGFLQRHRKCAAYPTTPHPSRRTAAPPSPQGEGLKSAQQFRFCAARSVPPHKPSPRGAGAERSEADEVERPRPPPAPPVLSPKSNNTSSVAAYRRATSDSQLRTALPLRDAQQKTGRGSRPFRFPSVLDTRARAQSLSSSRRLCAAARSAWRCAFSAR